LSFFENLASLKTMMFKRIFRRFPKLKKTLTVFLLVSVLLPTLAQPILAYDSTPEEGTGPLDYYADIFQPAIEAPEMNLESFVHETFKALLFGIPVHYLARGALFDAYFCGREAGNNPAAIAECVANLIIDIFTHVPTSQVASASNSQENVFVSLQKMPLSGLGHLKWWGQKLGIAAPAHAQAGFGYQALNAIVDQWSNFRNAAYALVAIFFVVIGFMIMFRMKISPQTVVTIQTALPKVIVTLLLITFSYAIVGFMIDLAWVLTLLFANLLGAPEIARDSLINDNVLGFIFDMAGPGFLTFVAIMGNTLWNIIGIATIPLMPAVGLLALIIFLIFGIVILIAVIKIWIMLIKAFIYTVLYTIIGPLWILLGMLPGIRGIGSWFKAVITQIVVFPATAALLVMAYTFMPSIDTSSLESIIASIQGFLGDLTASPMHLPLMGPTSVAQAKMYIALGIITFTPKIAKTIQQLTKTVTLGEGLDIGIGGILAATGVTGAFQRRFGGLVVGGEGRPSIVGRGWSRYRDAREQARARGLAQQYGPFGIPYGVPPETPREAPRAAPSVPERRGNE
jgi:hypothetical protein